MNDYERVLRFVYHKGQWQGSQLLAPDLFDAQAIEPYPDAVIGNTPGAGFARYGLTAWLECNTPPRAARAFHLPAHSGSRPGWVAPLIIARFSAELNEQRAGSGIGPLIQQSLKPHIAKAVAAR